MLWVLCTALPLMAPPEIQGVNMDCALLTFLLHHFHLEFLNYFLFLVGPDILGSLSVFLSTVFIYTGDGPGDISTLHKEEFLFKREQKH